MKKRQYFTYPPIKPSERLVYEFLSIDNSECLYQMFHKDPDLFVDERFKER